MYNDSLLKINGKKFVWVAYNSINLRVVRHPKRHPTNI